MPDDRRRGGRRLALWTCTPITTTDRWLPHARSPAHAHARTVRAPWLAGAVSERVMERVSERTALNAEAALNAELRHENLSLRREQAKASVKLKAAEERVQAMEKRCSCELQAAVDAERRRAAIEIDRLQSEADAARLSADVLSIALDEEKLAVRRAREEASHHREHAALLQRKLLEAQSHLYGAHMQLEAFASKAPPRILREVASRVQEVASAAPFHSVAMVTRTPCSSSNAKPTPTTARWARPTAAAPAPAPSTDLIMGEPPFGMPPYLMEPTFAGEALAASAAANPLADLGAGATGALPHFGPRSSPYLASTAAMRGKFDAHDGQAGGSSSKFDAYVATLRQRSRGLIELSDQCAGTPWSAIGRAAPAEAVLTPKPTASGAAGAWPSVELD